MAQAALLSVKDIHSGYGEIEVLHGITFEVGRGEVVGVLGANGAGKSTLLKTIAGLVKAKLGAVEFDGRSQHDLQPHQIARGGLVMVPEARHMFPDLSVRENLIVGGTPLPDRKARLETLDEVFKLFPILREKAVQSAGSLSGGQQQMVAIGRALMSRPRMIMLDEPSLGLAPKIVEEVYEKLAHLKRQGLTTLLVEQDVHRALAFVDRAHVLENGSIGLSGTGQELSSDDHIRKVYLGM